MIGLLDSWGDRPPPPGGADDDDLLAATGAEAVILVGDRDGMSRAEAIGVNVVAHIGARPGPAALIQRRIKQRLPLDVDVRPLSIWTAGMIGKPLAALPQPAPLPERQWHGTRPFILPIASDPRDIDAFRLVLAAALIEAAGGACIIGLPTGARAMPRARRVVAKSDRIIPVEALAHPAAALIRRADLLLDVGITPGGAIDTMCNQSGAQRVDARSALTPMSIAVALRGALRNGAAA